MLKTRCQIMGMMGDFLIVQHLRICQKQENDHISAKCLYFFRFLTIWLRYGHFLISNLKNKCCQKIRAAKLRILIAQLFIHSLVHYEAEKTISSSVYLVLYQFQLFTKGRFLQNFL